MPIVCLKRTMGQSPFWLGILMASEVLTLVSMNQRSNTNYAVVQLNGSAAGTITQMETDRRADEIVKRAQDAPELALPQAEAAPVAIRIPALLGVARLYVQHRPALSKQALKGVLAAIKDDSTGQQWRAANESASLYLNMGDTDLAAQACSQASKLISIIYKQESDGDDPNQAIKLFWASAHAWRDVLDTTSKISTRGTFDLLKQIPDPRNPGPRRGHGSVGMGECTFMERYESDCDS
jgi:hypothetical protein